MRLEVRRPSGPPEDSIAIRVVVACAVAVAIAAVVAQPGAVPISVAVGALVLAPLGYWYSYRRRRSSNLLLKVALSVALLAALGQFLGDVRGVTSVDQARIPLASLFLWVQVLHAFDVPRRRDLAFSMISSLILVAEAGSLSLTTSFLVFLVPWAALSAAWLSLSARPRADQVATPVAVRRSPEGRASRTAPIRSAAATASLALLAACLVFLAMPRLPGDLRANATLLARRRRVAGSRVRRERRQPRAAVEPGEWHRGLHVGWLSGLQRRRRPAGARQALRRPRVPGPRAAGGAVAGPGLRSLRRRHLDDDRGRDVPAGPQRRRALGDRARRRRARQRRARGRLFARRADVLHRVSPAQRGVRGGERPGGVLPGGRPARGPGRLDPLTRSSSTADSCTRWCRRCRRPALRCSAGRGIRCPTA